MFAFTEIHGISCVLVQVGKRGTTQRRNDVVECPARNLTTILKTKRGCGDGLNVFVFEQIPDVGLWLKRVHIAL